MAALACNIVCERFPNASRAGTWSIECQTPDIIDGSVKLYFDDINYDSDSNFIQNGEISDSVSLNVVGSFAAVTIENTQPRHFITYTLQGRCSDDSMVNSVFTLLEKVSGSHSFKLLDYVLFGLFLFISLIIGVSLAVRQLFKQRRANKDATMDDFLLASRTMHMVPLSMSLLCSFLSPVTLMGTPSEVYVHGTQYLALGIGLLLWIPLAANVIMPVFYKLRITSVNEFLEKRFSKLIRRIAAFVYIVYMLLYLAVVIAFYNVLMWGMGTLPYKVVYTPSIAMEAVTGLNMWISAGLSAGICIIYTSLGGLRAAVWTDVFQVSLMIAGLMAIIIQSSIREGGLFDRAWTMAERGGRFELFNLDPNPLLRHTFWTVSLGAGLTWGFIYSANQAQIQRAISAKNLHHAKMAYWLNLPGLVIFFALSGMMGITIYSRYAFCDPLMTGRITKRDQILPVYVMEVLSEDLPGFPGLFLAMLFSGLNGLGAVFVSDFAQEFLFERFNWREKIRAQMTRLFTLLFGLIIMILLLIVQTFPGILDTTVAVVSALGGPIFGLFVVGIFLPFVKWQPTLIGLIVTLAVNIWLILGNMTTRPQNYKILKRTTVGCFDPSINNQTQPELMDCHRSGWDRFYSFSYAYYSVLGMLGVAVTSLLLTPLFGCENPEKLRNDVCNQTAAKWTFAIRRKSGFEFADDNIGDDRTAEIKDIDENERPEVVHLTLGSVDSN